MYEELNSLSWHTMSCEGSYTSEEVSITLEKMTQVELLTERYLGESAGCYEQMTAGELWRLEWKLAVKL